MSEKYFNVVNRAAQRYLMGYVRVCISLLVLVIFLLAHAYYDKFPAFERQSVFGCFLHTKNRSNLNALCDVIIFQISRAGSLRFYEPLIPFQDYIAEGGFSERAIVLPESGPLLRSAVHLLAKLLNRAYT